MRAARALFLLLLISLPSAAAPTKVVRSTAPHRYRIGDGDRPRHGAFLQRIENALPVFLLVFLGWRGNVQVSGDVGNVRVSAGNGGR